MFGFIFKQEQDSTTIKSIKLPIGTNEQSPNSLQITRKPIDISSLDHLIDSSRTNKPIRKVVPVIKTVPFVPQKDSLISPVYNTFTGEFDLPKEYNDWDVFGFTPIRPVEAESVIVKSKINQKIIAEKTLNVEEVFSAKDDANIQGFKNADWMLGVAILAFVVFGWINVRFSRFVKSIVGASYNYFIARRLQEEGNVVRSKVFFVMNILFFINAALVIAQWFDYNSYEIFGQNGIVLFLILFASIIILYCLKSLFLLLLDFIFLTKGVFLSYNSTVFIYNKILGFALLPLVAIIPFVSTNLSLWLFYIALFLFGFLYLIRLLRGIQIGFKNRLSILYLILYLCALEILPILILYHTIEKYV